MSLLLCILFLEQQMTTKRDVALAYAEFGWHVFPSPPGTKASYKTQEQYDTPWGQTNNPADIHRDWLQWPDANIGLPCGKQNGIFVAEVDTLDGGHSANGFVALAELETKYGKLPDTWQAISPSGSVHYYFNYPDNVEIRNSTSKIGSGIDIRGEGGMVIVPPSRKGDKIYTWHNIVEPADAPPWLIDLAKEQPPPPEPSSSGLTAQHQRTDLDKVLRALISISPDCNYDTWFKVLCALLHQFGATVGFHLAEKWSRGSANKYNATNFRRQWKSIIQQHQSNRPITIATLFHLAKGQKSYDSQ
jgi:hypothetical protein